jgi:hypothetical protein
MKIPLVKGGSVEMCDGDTARYALTVTDPAGESVSVDLVEGDLAEVEREARALLGYHGPRYPQ